jgi:uncharacterized membrane protein
LILSVNRTRIVSAFYRLIACSLISFVFFVAVYRASTQSIAHDEALTYEWFLDGSVYHLLHFNSTNHVLFTILAKFFVKLFGTTELSLRAPSLIGAAGYLTFTYLLCRRLFGHGMLFLLSIAMLCLNPLLMDFMAAARGYSLGMAFLVAAMYMLSRLVARGPFNPDDPGERHDSTIASVLLGLSVAANLSNIFPAASLTIAFLAIVFERPLLGFRWLSERKLRIFVLYFIVPGPLVGLFIMWPFLIQARPAQFYAGLNQASDALRDLFNSSFLYKWTGDVYSTSLGAVPPSPGSWQQRMSDLGVDVIFPLVFFFVFLGLILVSRSSMKSRERETADSRLFGTAAIACVLLTILSHVLLKVNYPVSRTCLYFIPLFTLSSLLIARELSFRFPRYHLKMVGMIVAVAVIFDYALSLNTKYFRYNAYDVISRQLFWCISDDAHSRGLTGVRVGGTWWYEPEINFYRRRYKAEWMKPYDVKDRSYFWESPNSLPPAEYDYFVFTSASDPGLTGPGVRTIFRDRVTDLTVTAKERRDHGSE